jgi:hypothetical protein
MICLFIYLFIDKSRSIAHNRIGGVMVSVLASNAVDREFESRLSQTKDYKIGICCFSAKQAALSRKSKDWLDRNQNNVSEWRDISLCGLLHHRCAIGIIMVMILWLDLILYVSLMSSSLSASEWLLYNAK